MIPSIVIIILAAIGAIALLLAFGVGAVFAIEFFNKKWPKILAQYADRKLRKENADLRLVNDHLSAKVGEFEDRMLAKTYREPGP